MAFMLSPMAILRQLEDACFTAPWTDEQIKDELSRTDSIRIFLDAHGTVQEFSRGDDDPSHGSARQPLAELPHGYCLVRLPEPGGDATEPAEIMRIAVRPSARQKGAGRRLLAAAEHLALQHRPGLARFLLEVSEFNQPAWKLYAGAGYREIHRRRNYYQDGSDAVILEKRTSRKID